jgi:hypothetical protein
MDFLVETMHNGGPFMWLLLPLAFLGLPLPFILGGLGVARFRVPTFAWLAVPVLLVLLGAVGTWQGMAMVLDAVPHASQEMQSTLASAGYAVALLTSTVGLFLAAVLLLLSAWGAGVSAAAVRPGQRAGMARTVLSGGLLLLGGACLLVATGLAGSPQPLLALAMILGAPALALAVRQGETDEARARAAEHRLSAALCLLGALLCVGLSSWLHETSRLHEAIARADPSMRLALMYDAIQGQRMGLRAGLAGLVLAGIGGGLVCVPGLRDTPLIRSAVSAVLAGFGVLLSVSVAAVVVTQYRQLSPIWPAYALEGIDGAVSGLPRDVTFTDDSDQAPYLAPPSLVLLSEGGGWVRRAPDGATSPVSLPLDEETLPLLVIPGDRPASLLSGTPWGSREAHLLVLLHSDPSPGAGGNRWLETARRSAARIHWHDPAATAADREDGIRAVRRAIHTDDSSLIAVADGSGVQVLRPDGSATRHGSLPDAAADLRGQLAAGDILTVYVAPGPGWTVQDIVSLCGTVAAADIEENTACTLVPAYSPPAILPADGLTPR